MSYVIEYFKNLKILFIEIAPWLLLGFVFAGLLKIFIPQKLFQKQLGRNNLTAAIKAALLGIPLPLCSCGVIPTTVGLRKKGASLAATQSFLIATPQTGIDSILATQGFLGFPFAFFRVFAALTTGIIGGGIMSFFPDKKPEKIVADEDEMPISKTATWKVFFKYAFVDLVQDIGKWLIIGLLIAAGINTLIPNDFFQNYLNNTWLEFLVILLISIPLYVCATGSIPIATSLMLKGISPGAAFVLLMAGPATNVATITVLNQVMGRKFTLIYLLTISGGAIFFGWIINHFLLTYFLINSYSFEQNTPTTWFAIFAAIILLILLLYSLLYIPYSQKNNTSNNHMKKIHVEGMTCNHCKLNVEKNLKKLDNITHVSVNLANKTVEYDGEVSEEKIKETLIELGYQPQ